MKSQRRTRSRRALLVTVLAMPMLAAAPLASASLLDTTSSDDTHRYLCVHVDTKPPIGFCVKNNR